MTTWDREQSRLCLLWLALVCCISACQSDPQCSDQACHDTCVGYSFNSGSCHRSVCQCISPDPQGDADVLQDADRWRLDGDERADTLDGDGADGTPDGDGESDPPEQWTWHIETVDTDGAGFELSLGLDDRWEHILYTKSGELHLAERSGGDWKTTIVYDNLQYDARPALSVGSDHRLHALFLDSPILSETNLSLVYGVRVDEPDAAFSIEHIDIPDSSFYTLQAHDIVTAEDGQPVVFSSFGSNSYKWISVATREDSSWNWELMDIGLFVFEELEIDAHGRLYLAYRDHDGILRYDCLGDEAESEVVDWSEDVISARLAIDHEGSPHLVYYDSAAWMIRYASWNGSSFDVEDVVSETPFSLDLSIGPLGEIQITYGARSMEVTEWELRHLRMNGASSDWIQHVVDSSVAQGHELVVDSSGLPHIAYYRVAHDFDTEGELRLATVTITTP